VREDGKKPSALKPTVSKTANSEPQKDLQRTDDTQAVGAIPFEKGEHVKWETQRGGKQDGTVAAVSSDGKTVHVQSMHSKSVFKFAPADLIRSKKKTDTESVETPAEAVAEVKQEMQNPSNKVAQRDPRDIKNDIIEQLEEAIKKAPTNEEIAARAEEDSDVEDDFVEFSIPGDGTFKIINTKENIEKVLKRAKQLGTKNLPIDKAADGANKPTAGYSQTRADIMLAIKNNTEAAEEYRKQAAKWRKKPGGEDTTGAGAGSIAMLTRYDAYTEASEGEYS
jgi:hypothetical protein